MSESRDDVFEGGWLALREPVDHRSRSGELVDALHRQGVARGWSRALDLGTGTGSNLRYLAPRLPWVREWVALDHDASLLARVEVPGEATVTPLAGDLAEEGLAAVAGVDVVAGSALLDLVSAAWARDLAHACAEAGCGVHFALSYDGTVRFQGGDPHPVDAFVVEALNRHQRREKGMGRALGPDATDVLVEALEGVGYTFRTAASPWVLSGEGDAALAGALMDGWVAAVVELHPEEAAHLEAWRARRGEDVRAGKVTLSVGHQDLLAFPSAREG